MHDCLTQMRERENTIDFRFMLQQLCAPRIDLCLI